MRQMGSNGSEENGDFFEGTHPHPMFSSGSGGRDGTEVLLFLSKKKNARWLLN